MTELEDLQKQLEFESYWLGEYSKTRTFTIDGGKQKTVTIANEVDIIKKRNIVEDLQKRIDNILNPPVAVIPPEPVPEITPIIEDKPNIIPNNNDQLGNSLEPIITQIQKPENKGLILISGLIAAAILLK